MADCSAANMASSFGVGAAPESIGDVVNSRATRPAEDVIVIDATALNSASWPEIVQHIRRDPSIAVAVVAADLSDRSWAEIQKINTRIVAAGGILEDLAGRTIQAVVDRFTSEPAMTGHAPYEAHEASEQRGDWGIYDRRSEGRKNLDELIAGANSSGGSCVS